jgi:hypothetical protein
MSSEKIYGYWNPNKDAEPGFTKELISCDTHYIIGKTDLETLDVLEDENVKTLYDAL